MKRLDPARVAAAVRRVREAGERIEVAAAAEGVGESSLRSALKVAAAVPAPAKSRPRRRVVAAPKLRAKRGTVEADLEILDQEVDAIRTILAQKRDGMARGDTAAAHGYAAASAELTRLLKLRKEIRPPERSEDDEERRWMGARDRVLMKIEAGVVKAEGKAA